MSTAPIALFAYNRPYHLEQTIAALKLNTLAKQSDIFIYSDGPRSVDQAWAVAEVRKLIADVSGFKSVTVVERNNNWGLANSIIDGVTQLCKKYGKVIVLEDDLLSEPNFLVYMNMALERYENEDQVMQISGFNFPLDIYSKMNSFFLPLTTSWGWATWERSWKSFEPADTSLNIFNLDSSMRIKFDVEDSFNYFNMLESQVQGNIDSWAIRWYLHVFSNRGLVLYPTNSMIMNMGFDGTGTHCGKHDSVFSRMTLTGDKSVVFDFPRKIETSLIHYQALVKFFRKLNNVGIIYKMKIILHTYLNKFLST